MLERGDCTTANWLSPPHTRWSFWHVREMTRTATIRRGTGPVRDLPGEHDASLLDLRYEFGGVERVLRQGFVDNCTDAMLVVHDGRIAFEWYVNGARRDDAHLVMSAAKSHTALLCGVLVGKGLLTTEDLVTDHLAELRGTAWEGCRVQDLLDMRGGTKYDYERDEWNDMYIAGWVTHDRHDLPVGTRAWIESVENDLPHGTGPFRYCSLQTAVLGWICERVGGGRFSDLFSRDIWSRIGAEYDADVVVDTLGFQGTNGTMSLTLRDWGRLGLMLLDDGQAMGEQVIPAQWLARLRERRPELIEAYRATQGIDETLPDSCYHDQWWISDPTAGIYSASGANGQVLTMHHRTNTVVATFSSFPGWLDHTEFDNLWAQQLALIEAVTGWTSADR
jgi:CubicO group peptidase (beta-lactamase class C family)